MFTFSALFDDGDPSTFITVAGDHRQWRMTTPPAGMGIVVFMHADGMSDVHVLSMSMQDGTISTTVVARGVDRPNRVFEIRDRGPAHNARLALVLAALVG